MTEKLKCLSYNISERVIFEGKEMTIVAICLGHVMLLDLPFSEIKSNEFTYGTWIDLDLISKIN